MAGLDLVIRGGEIVNVDDAFQADVGIANGKIVQIGGDLTAHQEIDARARAKRQTAAVGPAGENRHRPVRAASKAAGQGERRNRLEVITGSIVLVLAAIIGITLRRKPPTGTR